MGLFLGWIWRSNLGWTISIPAFSLDIWVSTWARYGGPSWAGYLFLKVWWHEASLYWFSSLFTVHSFKFIHSHSFITFAEFHSSFFIDARSVRGSPLGCRAEIRTRGRLTAARHARYQLSQCRTLWAGYLPCILSGYMGLYLGWIWGSIMGWISITAFSLDLWVLTWAGYGGPSWAGYLSESLAWIFMGLYMGRKWGSILGRISIPAFSWILCSLLGLDMGIYLYLGPDIYPCVKSGYMGWIWGSLLGWIYFPALSLDTWVST